MSYSKIQMVSWTWEFIGLVLILIGILSQKNPYYNVNKLLVSIPTIENELNHTEKPPS